MPTLQRFCAALLFCVMSNAVLADECYVIGDTSKNNASKPVGSKQNPYGSLADVELDASCKTIIVLYSGVVLDGGISLRDGQELKGKKGPAQALPIISNTTVANNGHGVQLAEENSIANLHVTDTQNSGVHGGDVGKLSIQNSLITRFALSGDVFQAPPPLDFASNPSAGIEINPTADVKIRISDTEIGEANSTSVGIISLAGHADIVIEDVSIRDQGHLAGATTSNGIAVFSLGQSSVDLRVQDTSVSNIGAPGSNSDALLFLAVEASAMKVLIDGYSYDNPDGDGSGSATGIEVGTFFGNGASFEGTITNSVIRGAKGRGIQAIDQAPGVGNFLDVHIRDNEIYDSSSGIGVDVGFGAENGTHIVRIEENLIVDPIFDGIAWGNAFAPQTLVQVLIQRNTVINAGFDGLFFIQVGGASVDSLHLDAGLGILGSQGKNRIIGSQGADVAAIAINADPFTADAANNWWGSDAGPATVTEDGASVIYEPFLFEDPGTD